MERRRKSKEVKARAKRPLVRETPKDASTKVRDLEERLAGSCACGSSGAAVCGAGGVMAWERGRGEGREGAGKGREGAEAVDVDYALALPLLLLAFLVSCAVLR